MFYYRNWEELCKFLNELGVRTCTAEQSLSLANAQRFVVLKHDVETNVSRAYKLASIEHAHGICGSYYVQAYLLDEEKNIRMLQEMQSWGHEISYHYDVLDACNGDYVAAEESFERYMKVFNANGFRFKTICQHGNPVKKRDGYTSNRDFFRNKGIRNRYPQLVDIVVNYSEQAVSTYKYISDAGYRWNIFTEPETDDLHPGAKNVRIGDFKNLMSLIKGSDCSYIISTHPHRWKDKSWKINIKIAAFRVVRNTVMLLRHVPGIEWLLNKFYFLAKKI